MKITSVTVMWKHQSRKDREDLGEDAKLSFSQKK